MAMGLKVAARYDFATAVLFRGARADSTQYAWLL
jgi:hypothetical protein